MDMYNNNMELHNNNYYMHMGAWKSKHSIAVLIFIAIVSNVYIDDKEFFNWLMGHS